MRAKFLALLQVRLPISLNTCPTWARVDSCGAAVLVARLNSGPVVDMPAKKSPMAPPNTNPRTRASESEHYGEMIVLILPIAPCEIILNMHDSLSSSIFLGVAYSVSFSFNLSLRLGPDISNRLPRFLPSRHPRPVRGRSDRSRLSETTRVHGAFLLGPWLYLFV